MLAHTKCICNGIFSIRLPDIGSSVSTTQFPPLSAPAATLLESLIGQEMLVLTFAAVVQYDSFNVHKKGVMQSTQFEFH